MAFDSAGEAVGYFTGVACCTLLLVAVPVLIITLIVRSRGRTAPANVGTLPGAAPGTPVAWGEAPGPQGPPGASGIWYEGGPGDTIERAIIIRGAASSVEGVQAERQYLTRQYGPEGQAWRVVHQATLTRDGRHYDALTIGWSNGAQQTMYFDITAFFSSSSSAAGL